MKQGVIYSTALKWTPEIGIELLCNLKKKLSVFIENL